MVANATPAGTSRSTPITTPGSTTVNTTNNGSLTTVTNEPSTAGDQSNNTLQTGASTAPYISSSASAAKPASALRNTPASNLPITSGASTAPNISSSASAAKSASTLRNNHAANLPTTIHPPSKTASVVLGANTECPKPIGIPNGQLMSKGPYIAGKTDAIYACVTGFSLVGPATIKCGLNGAWPKELPQCIVSTTGEQGGNNIYVGDSLPLWLAIVLGATFGVICLMLLVCLVAFCLRMCGCWKGALFGEPQTTSTVAPSTTGQEIGTPISDKGTSVSYIELEEPFDDYQMHMSTGNPPDDSRYYFNTNTRGGKANRGGKVNRGNRFVEEPNNNNYNSNEFVRKGGPRRAKRPPKSTWMPHSQQRRNINTSTN